MSKRTIENLIFKNKSKDQLIEDTLTSLSALLADVFTGDDVNELKSEFPENLKLKDIGIELLHVALYLENKEFETPSIEISIKMVIEKQEYELGIYSLIFNENGDQIDEILDLN
ncbi:MAG: hypothetical protein A2X13_12710 [Bacteroidetes bacterium GWC2_33_15]|nr:MAG: hypothetical protein A2X10_13985 [Bacteroidetes bacterium GWA2_33_15]OFX50647.1 MAG: hypothetical protein A2X13_12710 [Bacteroidetes bacterium GWC2_33_15]OFX63257.1 MAG: hypothetical protein A2X15_02090 [Bacteroidetes bacterium GWB2_32_14]OFX69796.1 MAG: hypothetical protein A2X14_05385 [Bacteroidetes bacterium GWD2_33_33]HAN19837.1 hypothetical protein [Bacteroidales bacterium]